MFLGDSVVKVKMVKLFSGFGSKKLEEEVNSFLCLVQKNDAEIHEIIHTSSSATFQGEDLGVYTETDIVVRVVYTREITDDALDKIIDNK